MRFGVPFELAQPDPAGDTHYVDSEDDIPNSGRAQLFSYDAFQN